MPRLAAGAKWAAKRVRAPGAGFVLAVDLLEMEPIEGVVFSKLDFLIPMHPNGWKFYWAVPLTLSCRTWRPMPPDIGGPITSG